MSGMAGNPHADDAARYIAEASSLHDWPLSERHVIAANSQALATMALAYEQRTANLIALASINPEWYGSTSREEFAKIGARLNASEATQ